MIRGVSLTEEVFVNAGLDYTRCSHIFKHVNFKPPEQRLAVVTKKRNKQNPGKIIAVANKRMYKCE